MTSVDTSSVDTLGDEQTEVAVWKLGRLLLGSTIRVGVSEPWDFDGPYEGGLKARIEDAGKDKEGKQWIALEVEPFESEEDVTITRLLARGRYTDELDIVRQVAEGEHATVSLSYEDQVPEDKKIPGVVPKLIGNIQLR